VGRWLDLVNYDVKLVCFGASGGARQFRQRGFVTCALAREMRVGIASTSSESSHRRRNDKMSTGLAARAMPSRV
jgi:hypothetical protein